ncbi:MAG: hypothetical protein RBR59_06610 [Sulfurimonadaceae bacterium]|jgi:hypothetical protein|nr:hypothetical protein [Sulfurimonadaceae bacterium]
MKAYIKITILLLSSALLYANEASIEQIQNNELSWVDEQVNAIKPARNGLKESAINVVKNPFIHLDKNKIKKEGEKTATPAFLADRIIPVGITNSQTDVTQKKGKRHTESSLLMLLSTNQYSSMANGTKQMM